MNGFKAAAIRARVITTETVIKNKRAEIERIKREIESLEREVAELNKAYDAP
ncbi:hypothetical protein [Paraburkholderia sp. BR14374]|uniref:hypothetical protein n=1 Tax=Paraburkholderia sp. BR14374 TaxID=3237007 RepID=UPI0034CDD182